MTKTQFRMAVSLSMLLGVSGLVAFFVGESRLPVPLQEHLRQQQVAELGTIDWILLGLALPLVVVGMASFVGLLRFSPWSRAMAVGASITALVTLPFLGPTVEPGISTALYHLSSMSFGAIVAIAYCSPTVSQWFAKSRSNQPLQPMTGR